MELPGKLTWCRPSQWHALPDDDGGDDDGGGGDDDQADHVKDKHNAGDDHDEYDPKRG